jgi:prolyl oligopeptidase
MPMTRMCQCSAVDIIHDTMVPDPYRWLENRTSPETGGWIEAQQKRCGEYFESCNDLTAIRDRVRMCLDVVKLDQPVKVGRRYFYRRRDRGEEQASLYLNDQSTDTEQCLISPSNNGRFASVGIYRVSQSGALLAYETSRGGEDMKTIHFLDVTSGEVLSDRVQHGYPRGLEFAADDRSFYYCHETSPTARDHKILLHHFHEPVADQVVFRVARTRESRLVLTADHLHIGAVWIHRSEHSLVADFWIARRSEPTKWKKVFAERKLPFNPILKEGRIFALSYLEAPNGKVVELSLDGDEIRVVVPERQIKISHLMMRNKRIFANYTTHFCSSVMAWSLEGSDWEDVGIRKDGTVQFASNRGGDDDGG